MSTDEIFALIVGATVEGCNGEVGDEMVQIRTDRGVLDLRHIQDCCEHVRLEDRIGDWSDILGSQIVLLEERSSSEDPEGYVEPDFRESYTWTFYEIRTTKGDITLRFLGESNGYYGEEVYAYWTPKGGKTVADGALWPG
jgi:hypothetical protein